MSGLESLRGYAALAVFLLHLEVLFVPLAPGSLKATIHTFGLWAVPVFFALSAFSLLYGYSHRLFDERSLLRFYVRRVFRIVPLFYVMLAAWIVLTGTVNKVDLALNLSFLFPLIPQKVESIVPAGWSLGVEWIFYWAFPVFGLLSRSLAASTIALLICVLLSYTSQPLAAAFGYPVLYPRFSVLHNLMFFQVAVLVFTVLRRHQPALTTGHTSLIFGVTAAVILGCSLEQVPVSGDLLLVFGCGVWVACAFLGLSRVIDNPASRLLGRVSYSLYLIHPFLLYLLKVAGLFSAIQAISFSPIVAFWLSVAVSLVIVVVASVITYRAIESPGIALGEYVMARLTRSGTSEAPIRNPW